MVIVCAPLATSKKYDTEIDVNSRPYLIDCHRITE
jgi:hypothetical protein